MSRSEFKKAYDRHMKAREAFYTCQLGDIPDDVGEEMDDSLEELMRTRASLPWEVQEKCLFFAREVFDTDFFQGAHNSLGWFGFLMADMIELATSNRH